MSSTTWTPPAVSSEAHAWVAQAWRIVEAQHASSTMKLVDNATEHSLLESLIEDSKPARPLACAALDYLLATPFRYPTRQGGSRFRRAIDPGVFYGAQGVRTACAELGFWRWRFLKDAVDLDRLEPVAHTAFRVSLSGSAVDLRGPPFQRHAARWSHPSDYGPTQALAVAARSAGVGCIVYRSVRDPDPAWCVAALSPEVFSRPKPYPHMQTWWLSVRQDLVVWQRDGESITFDAGRWAKRS